VIYGIHNRVRESGREIGSGRQAVPKNAGELLPSVPEAPRQSNEKRFACTHCSQHYAVDASSLEPAMVCLRCGRTFQPELLPPDGPQSADGSTTAPGPEDPAAPQHIRAVPTTSKHPVPVRMVRRTAVAAHGKSGLLQALSVQVLALFTPLMVVGSMSLGLVISRLLGSLGKLTFVFALPACPLIGYFVTVKLCRLVCHHGGTAALQTYLRSTVMSFILWGVISIGTVGFSADSLDEGAGLLIYPILLGGAIAFAAVFIVWGWSASTVWAAETGDEGPSVPWWRWM
jgi:hypothetical protein